LHKFCKIDKVGLRAVIMYLHIKGLSPQEIHEDMLAMLNDNAPSYTTVKNGQRHLNEGGRAWKMMLI